MDPIISIDVSKSNSYAAAFLSNSNPYAKPFKFIHPPKRLDALTTLLKDMEGVTGVTPKVVLEATGNYSKPIVSYFINNHYEVIVLNPLQTHNQKKKTIRKVTTDPVDANRISKVYYLNDSSPAKLQHSILLTLGIHVVNMKALMVSIPRLC